LVKQKFTGNFEVIVVVDGSQDGTASALGRLDTPFPLRILEQPNHGAATARNVGAAAARGEILLFLDDDMVADPHLLSEHDRSHQQGADMVLGHIPLHPETPSTILSRGVKTWTDRRLERLTAPGAELTLHDLLTGQMSLSRVTFYTVGGFDTDFTYSGSFGDEDIDFAYRVRLRGFKIIFNPKAVSWQYYAVQSVQFLRQWRQAGHADVAFARKHPEQARMIFLLNGAERRINRYAWRPLVAIPILNVLVLYVLRRLVLTLVHRGRQGVFTSKLFFSTKRVEYWRGVREAGGIPERRTARVLAYHAVADLDGAPVVGSYAVPPDAFRRQLDSLERAGFRFLHPDEFLRFLHGSGGLPRRALLLTFDDCYRDLLDVVSPILQERRIPAIGFAVSGCLGGTNVWDATIGAPQVPLLNADGLRQLTAKGFEIGAHSRTHRSLPPLSAADLDQEIAGSVEDLEKIGLRRPRLFAYPYGESDYKIHAVIRKADLQAAFLVLPGVVRAGHDPFRIPRIEILRNDVGWKFRWKIAMAGRSIFFPLKEVHFLVVGLRCRWRAGRTGRRIAGYSA
jgi:peptidoglycan/xylan/chitin deacetylase (PgdA/CDA1 family)/GT2 family glycosyltransferase